MIDQRLKAVTVRWLSEEPLCAAYAANAVDPIARRGRFGIRVNRAARSIQEEHFRVRAAAERALTVWLFLVAMPGQIRLKAEAEKWVAP